MADLHEHFRGLLSNVDSSITGVDFGEGLVVSERDRRSVWHWFPGVPEWQVRGEKVYIVEKNTQLPVPVPQPSPVGHSVALGLLLGKLALLRLYKEGNPRLVYATSEMDPGLGYLAVYYPEVVDFSTFSVNDAEAAAATALLSRTNLPFRRSEVQLAFDNFQLSYEVRNSNLAFLALMIALEVMLSDGDQDKAYRVSRNAAVLLGHDKGSGHKVFADVKRLYTKRSRLVHSGYGVTHEEMLELREYARGILKRVIALDANKKDLLRALDEAGFGEHFPGGPKTVAAGSP